MTIDQLIKFLTDQRAALGGDAEVAIEWDSALSHLKMYHVEDKRLVLDSGDWGSCVDIRQHEYVEKQEIPT